MKNKTPIRERFTVFCAEEFNEKHINPETGAIELDLHFDLINGQSYFINHNTKEKIPNESLQYGYIGEKKTRITTEFSIGNNELSFDFINNLNHYKHIFAIDTNVHEFNSVLINDFIRIGLGIAIEFKGLENEFPIMPIPKPFVTSINPEKPENENWIRLIEFIKTNFKIEDERNIGIVVDSDLGNIPLYNKRELPIFKDYYLPQGFELIFSSDKVSDNIFNNMIKLSHQLSNEYLPRYINYFQEEEKKELIAMNNKP